MSLSGIIANGLTQNVGEILLNGIESGVAAVAAVNGFPSTQPSGDPSWPPCEDPTDVMMKWFGDNAPADDAVFPLNIVGLQNIWEATANATVFSDTGSTEAYDGDSLKEIHDQLGSITLVEAGSTDPILIDEGG